MHVSCERNPRPYDRGFDFHQFHQRTDFSPSTKMLSMDATYLVGKPWLRMFWKNISHKGICMDYLPLVSTMPTFNKIRNGLQLMEISLFLQNKHCNSISRLLCWPLQRQYKAFNRLRWVPRNQLFEWILLSLPSGWAGEWCQASCWGKSPNHCRQNEHDVSNPYHVLGPGMGSYRYPHNRIW